MMPGIRCHGDQTDPPTPRDLCQFCDSDVCELCGEPPKRHPDEVAIAETRATYGVRHEFTAPVGTCDRCIEEIYGQHDDI